KKVPGLSFTAPGSGTVTAVERAAKRALVSVVIQLDASGDEARPLAAHSGRHPSACSGDEVRELLLESGLWTALRERPYGVVPAPDSAPRSIFVTAMDTNPLAPPTDLLLDGRGDDLERGLHALARLTQGPVYYCHADGDAPQLPSDERIRAEAFAGPHPAGTVGLHIHTLDPVHRDKRVWYVGLQDLLAIGRLFETGGVDVSRIVSLAGPAVTRPRLLRTRIGAAIDDLVQGELEPGRHRVISGSVLSGRTAMGGAAGFLGRYHQQVSVLAEGDERRFIGWLAPGADRFSTSSAFLSKLLPGRRFAMTTTTWGSDRAIVPIGLYEKVMPLDLEPSFLLKALVTGDVDRAEELGALELEEEDLALLTFVCPSKDDFGLHLRAVLDTLEKEG
ncbi:MAG: Na(+)-translocating NADH-quinone reductase subunit A, partial [Thermoanaerobaculia bacterium]|nr:Na(+)-translocating NADH-quinone reductase subunit A [Thermoanaerobaculia bacterium]